MDLEFKVSKGTLKSRTFWFTLLGMVSILVLALIDMNPETVIPAWISWLVMGVISLVVGPEKLKDATVGVSSILAQPAASIVKLGKPLVNDKASNIVAFIGIILTTVYGVLTAAGAEIGSDYIMAIDALMVLFVGADKYKNARIIAAENIKKKIGMGKKQVPVVPGNTVDPKPVVTPQPPLR